VSRAHPERVPLLSRPLASYYLVVGSTLLLLALGLVMVLSASSVTSYAESGSSFSIVTRQATWAAVGVPTFYAVSRVPTRYFRALGYPLLLASIVLLMLVPVIGKSVFGATRWLDLGPIQIQPSELAKLGLLLWGADLFARKQRLLGDWRHLLVPFLPVLMLLVLLVMLGSDLGSTLVLMILGFSLLWIVGAPGRIMGLLAAAGVAGVTMLALVEPYRLRRVTAFLHPERDPSGASYQVIQGLYGLASGRWFGVGLGASRQKWQYLPNPYTDFIFSIIGEELGLIGCLAVLLLFGAMAYAGVRIARRATDPFSRLVAGAITAWMLGQAIINMAAVTTLLPVTGITLPLVSFGGTSLVITLFALGMLAGVARREPGAAQALAARGSLLDRLRRRTERERPETGARRAAPVTVGER
jgi:cell division protein FtsW